MDFKELSYVTTLAASQSYTDAAKKLHISQPALSKCIKRLESDYGELFFTRQNNCTIPTEFGMKYVQFAESILSLKRGMDKELTDLHEKKFPVLRIAVTPVSGRFHISQTTIPFQRRHPNISLRYVEGITIKLYEIIKKGEADIAICSIPGTPLPEVPELDYIPLQEQELVLAVPAEHPIINMAKWKTGFRYPWISLNWVKQENLLLQSENQFPTIAARNLFRSYNFTPHSVCNLPNVHSAIDLACSGCGIAIVMDFHLLSLEQKTKLVPLSIGHTPVLSMTAAVYRKGTKLSEYMLDYIELVRDSYYKLYTTKSLY